MNSRTHRHVILELSNYSLELCCISSSSNAPNGEHSKRDRLYTRDETLNVVVLVGHQAVGEECGLGSNQRCGQVDQDHPKVIGRRFV